VLSTNYECINTYSKMERRDEITARIQEIIASLDEVFMNRTKLTSDDYEDVSDAYQTRLEEGWFIDELEEELEQLNNELAVL